MIFNKEKSLKDEIINIGKKLYALRLVVARSGNLSMRIDDNSILITATGTSLGSLTYDDIIKVDLTNPEDVKNSRLTSEFPLHSLVYKNFPCKVVIHCHPTLVNAYFTIYSDLKALTFETRLNLGNIPVVEQDTPTVTKPELAISALKTSNLVVLKNHGVVSMSDKFSNALYLIETLEEAVKVAATARLFKKEILDDLDKELKTSLAGDNAYLMFSKDHIQAIVDAVNKDEFIQKKGQELDLTMQYAIKLDGQDKVYKFIFEKGRITKLEFDDNAPFVASAPADVWEMIFLGKLDPFVATMQGKMKLKGELGKLSRWYVPFSRLFQIFKEVKIK
ncbi:MAG: class II aldolase/adducin family protein [Candidatus Omnitrophica bacterium]|nr:class II aldolase/adducin family protein [Candidatus Omnitrophota bacterium]